MPASERTVGGMSCGEVLAVLSDYVDGTIDSLTLSRVDAHLRGCDWCEQFGGRFADVVETLRRSLRNAEPLPREVASRLRDRLRGIAFPK
jgi:predicted anti-sigma-YlaC factor YlaD